MTSPPKPFAETCLACRLAFGPLPGESTSSLVHRYTTWREAHRDCALPATEHADAERTPPGPGPRPRQADPV
jgi:hypothetical protein